MTYRRYFICFVLFTLVTIGTAALAGDPPNKLNYQGILSNSTGQPITGSVSVKFSLYDVLTGGTEKWSEQQSVTLDKDGRFSVVLGSTTPLYPGLFTGTTYIGVKVGSDAEMPRQQLTSVAYALNAVPKGVIVMWSGTLETIPSGWALCDGELHEGTRTPNLKDRFVVGAGNDYQPNSPPGGEKTHVLTINEMPSHTHIQDSHTHIRGTQRSVVEKAGLGLPGIEAARHYQDRVMVDGTGGPSPETSWTTATNQYTGNGAAHNNMPPYYALAYIMKL
ncbi:MAG: hypothetical protein NTX45_11865 [Proteobacteria bacterium]|nr:hypothetical protein [Pseudomonadota bacterium]